jgi:ribonuclease HI
MRTKSFIVSPTNPSPLSATNHEQTIPRAKMDAPTEPNKRVFDPQTNLNCNAQIRQLVFPDEIVHYEAEAGVTRLLFYSEVRPYSSYFLRRLAELHDDTIVVSIAGVVRANEKTKMIAAFGVHFGGDASKYNVKGLVPGTLPQTSQVAELYALKVAIDAMMDISDEAPVEIKQLVIMTESLYLTQGLSKDIWKWEQNGWRTNKKTPVANVKAVKELHGVIKDLEGQGRKVEFWMVDRKFNDKASFLAIEALVEGGVEVQEVKGKKKAKKSKKPKKKTKAGSGDGNKPGDNLEDAKTDVD